MKNKISRWPLFFWKMYSFSFDINPHKGNKEMIPKHTSTLDSYCVPGTGRGTRLEPKQWAPKSDGEGLLTEPGLSVKGCSGWVITLFQARQDFGGEIIGGGVQVSGLGAQDRVVIAEEDGGGRAFGMHHSAGVTLPQAAGVVQQGRKNAGPGISLLGIESGLQWDLQVSFSCQIASSIQQGSNLVGLLRGLIR